MRSFMFVIALAGSLGSHADEGAPLSLASQNVDMECLQSESPDEVSCLEEIAAWSAHEWTAPKGAEDERLAAALILNSRCEEMALAGSMTKGTLAACFGDVVRMIDKCDGFGLLVKNNALKQHTKFAKETKKNPLSKLKLYGASDVLAIVAARNEAANRVKAP